jgi:hypothetical protein
MGIVEEKPTGVGRVFGSTAVMKHRNTHRYQKDNGRHEKRKNPVHHPIKLSRNCFTPTVQPPID